MSFLLQSLAVISEPPGSWVYHLVVLFALEAVAAIAMSQWWARRSTTQARLAAAAGGMFLLRLLVLVTALLPDGAFFNSLIVTPPLDRAASALTLLLIVWSFAFPEPMRLADRAALSLALVILLALGVTWAWWARAVAAGEAFFNNSIQETGWETVKILLLVGGLALLGIRRKADWPPGMGLLAALLAGHVLHYFFPPANTHFPAAERLVEVATLPLLAAMIFRRAHAYAAPVGAVEAALPATAIAAPRPAPVRSPLRQFVETIVLTAVFYFSIDFATGRFHVEGASMEPTMRQDQYVLIDKLSYMFGHPERGDVVAFHHPNLPEQDLIKRVIGLPGETISILDEAVYVNAVKLDEPYIRAGPKYVGTWSLSSDEYFVLGDNRNRSSDSHRWGPVQRQSLIGKALFIYWPPGLWGLVPQPTYASSN